MTETVPMRGVLFLSVGTIVTRALALSTQVVLVFWLTPAEFGYWAAASSALSLITGFINFGEVNGYLANDASSLTRTRRTIFRLNSILVIAALIVAGAYFAADNRPVAALAALIAISIPVQGDGDLMYAAGVRTKQYSLLIQAQSMGAVSKLLVAVGVAMWLESSLALAISAIAYFIVMDVMVWSKLRSHTVPAGHVPFVPGGRQRFSWAVNSLMMTMPLQAAYLVSQFIATPAMLGILFMAFQVTLGISGLVSKPLARVSLSVFATTKGVERERVAMGLMHLFTAGMSVVVAFGILILPWAEPWIGQQWAPAIPATLALLVSLTARIIAPVVDGFQQATNRWWQATSFNAIDAIGTGLAACAALTGDAVVLALAISTWKITFGIFRLLIVMRNVGLWVRILLAFPTLVTSAAGFIAIFGAEFVRIGVASALIFSGLIWFFIILRKQRRQIVEVERI